MPIGLGTRISTHFLNGFNTILQINESLLDLFAIKPITVKTCTMDAQIWNEKYNADLY